MRDFNLDVRCGAYGLKTNGPPAHLFIGGCPPEDLEDESPQIQAIEEATVAQITEIKVGELKQEATPPPDEVWVGESEPFWQEELYHVRQLNLRTLPELAFEDEMDWETCLEVAKRWPEEEEEEHNWARSVVVSHDPVETEQVVALRAQILKDYEHTVFREKLGHHPPKRGPLRESNIEIIPGMTPVKQRPFALQAERRQALLDIVHKLAEEGQI